MKCDRGKVQAYLDEALGAPEREAVEAHLAQCGRCREDLARLRQQGTFVAGRLQRLDRPTGPEHSAARALARFWGRARPAGRTVPQSAWARRWRPVAAGMAVLLVLGVLLSFAPIRQAAAEFLGLFRVRKFAVIPVDPARLEQISGMQDLVMAAIGEPTVLREAGAPQEAADPEAATALAGFRVRSPAQLPAGAVLDSVGVQVGPAVRVDVDRDQAEAILEAAAIEGVTLPQAETLAVTADIGAVVSLLYRADHSTVMVLQAPSPAVTLPDGVDPTQIGRALLLLLGMSEKDAGRMAQQIDWTSTLVIPLPTNVAQFREVTVDGVSGLLLEQSGAQSPDDPDAIVLWQRDDIIYVVAGSGLSTDLLLQMADSFR